MKTTHSTKPDGGFSSRSRSNFEERVKYDYFIWNIEKQIGQLLPIASMNVRSAGVLAATTLCYRSNNKCNIRNMR